MNRRTAMSAMAAAAVTAVGASRSQGQTLTLYQGPGYNTTTSTGYKFAVVQHKPSITAGNGMGVGDSSNVSNNATVAYRIDNTGNFTFLQSATAGSTNTIPYAINSAGTTVGSSNMYTSSGTSLGYAAVSWNASGGVTLLQNLGTNPNDGTSYGYAYAINAAGISTGQQYGYNSSTGTVYTSQYATRWNAAGTITQLTPLGTNATTGASISVGYAINSAGTVVGASTLYSGTTSLGSRPALWAAGGTTATPLGVLGTSTSGSTSGAAYAVNDAGTSVGNVAVYNAAGGSLGTAPARWDASGNVTQLGTLGVSSAGTFAGYALSVNSAGTAVGYSSEYNDSAMPVASLGARATVWTAGSPAVTELPNLGVSTTGAATGTTTSMSYSVNDDGLVVGSALVFNSSNPGGVTHATLWVPNATAPSGYAVTDLNSLLNPTDASNFVLTTAYSVSSTDWVTAVETNTLTNATQDVLFNVSAFDPVAAPEPTSLVLFASAAAVPFLGRRRRRLGSANG